ncbi:MAG: hypothetical protein ACYC7E_17365 [Armatimonadota bacterium]
MSTEHQIAVNRANAQKSTGPRTPEGKARSSRNALKHGFYAREAVLSVEDAAEYDDFARAMRDDLRPVGAMEEVLAGQVIISAWRLQRLACIEAGVFTELLDKTGQACAAEDGDLPETLLWGRAFADEENSRVLARLTRYQSLITREFYRAFHDLQRLQADRPPLTREEWLQVQNEPIHPSSLSLPPSEDEPIHPSSFILPPSENEPISPAKPKQTPSRRQHHNQRKRSRSR